MILFVAILAIITLHGVHKREEDSFLSKEMTATVNGVFAVCIFLSHCSEYIIMNGALDGIYRHFQNFHNQWIVASFLAFSGYGVMCQIVKSGNAYLMEYPKSRLGKTILNFDIAVLLYLLMDGILRIKYSTAEIIGSFVGVTSVGNSNWYIFAILIMYFYSYICARIFNEKYTYQAVGVTVGTIIYIAVLQLCDMPSRFISTILCYATGVWLCIYRKELCVLFEKRKIESACVIGMILLVTYKLRYDDYIMNVSSIFFVFAIAYFNVFFVIRSKILYFIGKHAFSIYIVQRIPMTIFQHYGILKDNRYGFVIIAFFSTIVIAVLFDKFINYIDNYCFVKKTA